MANSFVFLPLLLLLSAVAAASKINLSSDHKFTTRLHLFFHENAVGTPNATSVLAVDHYGALPYAFSSIKVYDSALRTTAALDSPVIGRAQGFSTFSDLHLTGGPTGGMTVMNLVFTAGSEYNGSTLALVGLHRSPQLGASERTIVGGSGRFRMARGVAYTWWVSPVGGAATNVVEGEIYLTEYGSRKSCE